MSSVVERCRAFSSVVESNLLYVKIVEGRCSTFLLFEVLSSVVDCVWPGARLSTRQSRDCACADEKLSRQNYHYEDYEGCAKSVQGEQTCITLNQLINMDSSEAFITDQFQETSRIFDTEPCEDSFKITTFLSSFHPGSCLSSLYFHLAFFFV